MSSICCPNQIAFVGDSLFALGCGRLFEGTPQQMYRSLGRLAELPGDTRLYLLTFDRKT